MPALADRQLSRAMRVYAIIDQNSHYVSRVPILSILAKYLFDVVSGLDLFIDAAEKIHSDFVDIAQLVASGRPICIMVLMMMRLSD